MAVEIEFANVVIRKAALAANYPGGLDAFAATDLPNYIEDEHLVRVGFMSTREADSLAESLTEHGLSYDASNQADVAIVQHDSCPCWLSTGVVGNTLACWLTRTDAGTVIKCTMGFVLRCPLILYDEIEELVTTIGITIRRSAPPLQDRHYFDDVLHISRGNALLAGSVAKIESKGIVGLWVTRDVSRRQYCVEDVQLVEELESLLLANGADNN